MTNPKSGGLAIINTKKWGPESWLQRYCGVGFTEVPYGTLGHQASIRNQRIDLYQRVALIIWNASPCDPEGQIGAYETAPTGVQIVISD